MRQKRQFELFYKIKLITSKLKPMTNDKNKQIIINYKCDYEGNHTCSNKDLVDTRTKVFTNKMDAIHFIGECTSCEHNIKDVYPELFWWKNDSKETANTNETLETFRINNNI